MRNLAAIFAMLMMALTVVVYFQEVQSRKYVDSKKLELREMQRKVEDANSGTDELLKRIHRLNKETKDLYNEKASFSVRLAELERYKRLVSEEKAKLEASLSDKDVQMNSLKDQVKELEESEKESFELKNRLRELENQLEELTSRNTTGIVEQEADKGLKKQGEDKEHGLVAEDKVETDDSSSIAAQEETSTGQNEPEAAGATKGFDNDDRKREQAGDGGNNSEEQLSKIEMKVATAEDDQENN